MAQEHQPLTLRLKVLSLLRKVRGLPFYVFGLLFVALFFILLIAGKDPEIDSIDPKIGQAGETLTITGKYFGKERGKVSLSGIVPVSSAYVEWTPRRITVRIPDDAASGLVYVVTSKGKSEGVLFTNKNDIPVVLRNQDVSGRPYIEAVDPEHGGVGGLLTITGRNFGPSRGNSLVYFTWAPVQEGGGSGISQGTQSIAATPLDYDYEGWSDRDIRLRVPMGASSGNLTVVTEKGKSNSFYFEIDQSVGSRIFKDKKTYTVQSSVDIKNASGGADSGLYLWVPRVQENSTQREVQLLNQDPPAEIENYNGLMLVYLKGIGKIKNRRVAQTFIVDRYAMDTKIDPDKVRSAYETERPLYKAYTSSNAFTPARDKDLGQQVLAVVGKEKNPYLKAQRIYSYLLEKMVFNAEKAQNEALVGYEEGAGGAYTYATLYVAMLRSTGIPSRTIAGYVITDDRTAVPHFWCEFYLEGYGWVPVDPALGDKARPGGFLPQDNPEAFYFGNMDNRHIAFSYGLVQARRISPHGRTIEQPEIHSLQTIYAEAVGDLKSYTGTWNNLQVVGVY